MEPSQTKKALTFEINGKHYNHIDDVPPEFRSRVLSLMRLDDRWKNSMHVKVTLTGPGDVPELSAEESYGSHREKFLRETVLPNLPLLDAATQAEVLRELGGVKKRSLLRRPIVWIILYAALGLFLLFGYSVIKNMFVAPR